MDFIPRELLIIMCGVIEDGATFKAWRLVCSEFYRASACWPGRTGRFANDLVQLIIHFPTANWDWPRLSFSEYIPFSFIEAFPDLPWTKNISDVWGDNPRTQIHWRRFCAIRQDTLVGCLQFSPDYEEFVDAAIVQYGEAKCFEALTFNDHLTEQFVIDHPSDVWDVMLYDLVGDSTATVIKFSKVIDWEYASSKISLKDIVEHPELPWVADVVAERDPDPLPQPDYHYRERTPLTYEYIKENIETLEARDVIGGNCRIPVEYVIRHHFDLSEVAMAYIIRAVHILEIFANPVDRQSRKINWENEWVFWNYFINWQLVVEHPEIDWDFDVLSTRPWIERWY